MDGSPTPVINANLLAEALQGLRAEQKHLSPKWLYDARGSALFEQITTLPEYYLTRTETAILRDRATQLAELVAPGGALVELGSGASVKTRLLLDAGAHFGAYVPIDISETFLMDTAKDLRARYPGHTIHPVVADFTQPVALPFAVAEMPKVGFFPGSTIGNVPRSTAIDLLAGARAWPEINAFLLGVDLVKDPDVLVAAYDDAAGVTAAFIGNILLRLNTEAGAAFEPDSFDYRATWNEHAARIEMALVSREAQRVQLGETELTFAAGEAIEISASRKFTPASLAALAEASGWRVETLETDPDALFAVAILRPA